jgi:hypothetical protein
MNNDAPGRKLPDKLSHYVNPSKLWLMELSEKDASECLKADKADEIVNAYMHLKPYQPVGLLSIKDLKELFFSSNTDNITA